MDISLDSHSQDFTSNLLEESCSLEDQNEITQSKNDESNDGITFDSSLTYNSETFQDDIFDDFKIRLSHILDNLPLPLDEQKLLKSRLLDRYFGLGRYLSNKSVPFFCDLKARYEDFHVNEISGYDWGLINRPKVHLTSLKVQDDDDSKWLPPKTSFDELTWLDASELIEQIKHFSQNKDVPETLIEILELNKDDRTKLHRYIRQEFSNCESSTVNKDQKSYLRLCKKRRKDSEGNQMRSDKRWPPGKPDYYRFVLYKENVDTESAIRAISGNMDVKRFAYCGTKDKRGITTQFVTGYRIRPTEVAKNAQRYNKKLKGHGRIEVGHFELVKEKLFLGHHFGNAFKIFLRNVRPLDRDKRLFVNQKNFVQNIVQNVEELSKTGFVNYFGTQRFGSMSMDNHLVGLHILKREWKQAILMILKPRNDDDPRNTAYNSAMNHYQQTQNAEEALKMLDSKSKSGVEGRLLQALFKNNNNFHNSLMVGMSRNMRMLYVHAFQSYIWNLLASFRFFINGRKILIGDLVYSKAAINNIAKKLNLPKVEEVTFEDELAWMNENQTEVYNENSIVFLNDENSSFIREEDIVKDKSGIIYVDKSIIDNYRIEDIYIPIVSYDTKIPNNIVGSFLRCTLKTFGVELDDFRNLTKEWCIQGSYRKFVGKLKNFNCVPFRYLKSNPPQLNSDLDMIKLKCKEKSNKESKCQMAKDQSIDECEEKEIGLFLYFCLDIGQYATIALRELTKLGTFCIESKQFKPKESIQYVLRHIKLREEFLKHYRNLCSEERREETEELIVKTVLDSEKNDSRTNASFDEFYKIIEQELENKQKKGLLISDVEAAEVASPTDDAYYVDGPSDVKRRKEE